MNISLQVDKNTTHTNDMVLKKIHVLQLNKAPAAVFTPELHVEFKLNLTSN